MATGPYTDRQLQVTLTVYDARRHDTSRVFMDRPTLVVGRGTSADLQVADLGLSRRHCQFTFFDRRLTVEDLGSRNGTWVNARRIDRMALTDGDQVRCGNVLIEVELREKTSDEPPPVQVLQPEEVDYDQVVSLTDSVDLLPPRAGDTTADDPPPPPMTDFDEPVAEANLDEAVDLAGADSAASEPAAGQERGEGDDVAVEIVEPDQPPTSAEPEPPAVTVQPVDDEPDEPAHLDPLPEYDEQPPAEDDHPGWVDSAMAEPVATPLHDAARRGKRELVIFLIGRGASMHQADERFGATPLHFAMAGGNEPASAYLLDKGAEAHATDRRGLTPLDWARIEGHAKLVDELTLRFRIQ